MQKNITTTIFYSLLFAMGGSPTFAMLLIELQGVDPDVIYQVFIGLTVIAACVFVPLVLIQNAFLIWKKKDPVWNERMEVVSQIYLGLDLFCLVFWLVYQFA